MFIESVKGRGILSREQQGVNSRKTVFTGYSMLLTARG
jgi:hypothetical protein